MRNYRSMFIGALLLGGGCALAYILKNNTLWGIVFWLTVLFLILLVRRKSVLQTTALEDAGRKGQITILVFCLLVILLCVLPMGLAPFWNGRIPMHRNQYELLTESILQGHLYIDYDDIDQKLLAMENPYDYQERLAQEIIYHWDHAFYKGHYYMYFGVVPVFLLFLPFRLLFGRPLVTFHATQFFSMFTVIAIFLLFYFIARKFFPKIPLGTYIYASAAITLICIGYCTQAPALYCTAISGGICMEVWSILLYFLAVFYVRREGMQVFTATLGALAGALAFGCRPPVALANILAVSLAITYVKNYKGRHIVRNFAIIAIPYVVVGILLMVYNYLRFENPFEFGQSYQLTSYDQTGYGFFGNIDIWRMIDGIYENFLHRPGFENQFPYITGYGGMLLTYPLMLLLVPFFSNSTVRKALKEDKNYLFACMLAATAVFISVVDVQWAPGPCERYRLDEYFVVGILMFLLLGYQYKAAEKKERFSQLVSAAALLSVAVAVLLFFVPLDANFAAAFPEKVETIRDVLFFRL